MPRFWLPLLLSVYGLSGAAALVYEVSWTRQVGEVLGHTAPTAGVVLAAYFIGLAIGYEAGGRIAARIDPLRGYAIAEIVAAVWAGLVPLLLAAAGRPSIAVALGSSRSPGPALLQAFLCLLLLLPATMALGTTLPLMAEAFRRGQSRPDWRPTVSAYALNTLGAMLGVVAASGVLLAWVGVVSTSLVGVGLSLACAAAAYGLNGVLRRRLPALENTGPLLEGGPDIRPAAAGRPAEDQGVAGRSTACLLAAVSGFVVLGLEVLYLRLFSLVLHNSSYSFGLVVAIFLGSLAVGALLVVPLSRWMTPRSLVAASLMCGAVAVVISVRVFYSRTGFDYSVAGGGLARYLLRGAGLAAVVLSPPIVLLGMTFPALWRSAEGDGQPLSATIGRLSLINTLAAAGGALAASFVLLPWLGLWRSFAAVAALAGLAAMQSLWVLRPETISVYSKRRRTATVFSGLVTLAMAAGLAVAPPVVVLRRHEDLIQHWESAYGWIDVVRNRNSGALDVRQNLHYRHGTTGGDTVREQRQAHLPLLLHPQPRDVLFLGLGTGVTASGAVRHPEIERITVVELIPEVVAAARLLGAGNRQVFADQRVRVVVDDARHYLLTSPADYDVVVGDLFVPWESETGYLYTQEHFERIRDRLRPGGFCCQWLALYQLGPDEFRIIADTFASVFPETTLWWGHLEPRRPMVALLGTIEPLHWDSELLSRRCDVLNSHGEELVDEQLRTPERLLESLLGQWPASGDAVLNTVEHPRIEFLTPWSQQGGRLLQGENLRRFLADDFLRLSTPSAEGGLPMDATTLDKLRKLQRYVLFGE